MTKLENQLHALDQAIQKGDLQKVSVSKSGTYWHIGHALKVIISIIGVMEASVPDQFVKKNSFMWLLIQWFGVIPRGKGRSPKRVLPPEQLDRALLEQMLKEAREAVAILPSLPPDKYFRHPAFGDMRKKKAIKFIGIHSHHHIKIINEIIEK